jgi:transglutaminase-like putative cysteine protease
VAVGLLAGAGWFAFQWWGAGSSSAETRTVVSPWRGHLELRESDEVVFEAVIAEPTRWRLAALDEYEGTIWKVAGDFDDVEDGVIGSSAQGEGEMVATVEVVDFSSIWVPTPPLATTVSTGDFALAWHEGTGTLTVSNEEDVPSPGTSYSVSFEPETLSSAGQLVQWSEPAADPVDQRFLQRLDDQRVASALASIASTIEDPSATTSEQIELLSGYFGDQFVIEASLGERVDSDLGSLQQFLTSGGGSEWDAVTVYAQLARFLDIPSRVVVGFTAGETVEITADGWYRQQIRGSHAAIWPEVLVDQVGWVAVDLV